MNKKHVLAGDQIFRIKIYHGHFFLVRKYLATAIGLMIVVSAFGRAELPLTIYTSDQILTTDRSVPAGGIFIPRNGGFEGRVGASHVFFEQHNGGIMRMVSGTWPKFAEMAKMDMIFELDRGKIDPGVEVRQSFDQSPQLLFLEEGNQRIGIRVLFKLFDEDHTYHGHGMTETWLYPDGQIFVTAATMFENRGGHQSVKKAYIEVGTPGRKVNKNLTTTDMKVPNQYMMVTTPNGDTPGLSLYWKSGQMDHNTYIYRSSFGLTGAPSYFRWPDYHRQAYTQRTMPDYINPEGEKAPWPPGRGAFLDQVVPMEHGIQLQWSVEPKDNVTASFNAFFRLAIVSDQKSAQALVDDELDSLTLKVAGGVIHGGKQGYNDQEGCYEIRKTGSDPTMIMIPPDTHSRTVKIKVIGLTGHGAVTARLDGQNLLPQLSSDGGIADDPLAPIHDQPEAPANAALLTIELTDNTQLLEIHEGPGIQLVYQSRDPRRNFMVYSSKMGPSYSGMQFSLLDGHARHMRGYGQRDWALTENLLQWFAYMGYSPEQMLDQLRDFEVVKNGPDEVIFKYVSNNANDGAESTFEVTLAADSPAMQMNVRASFTVLDQWPYKSVQFFDVFPFKGVEPKDWWYDQALFMDSQGKWRTFANVNQTFDGEQDKYSTGPTFQGLFSADRGNMLMLTRNFTPNLPTHYVICSNYIDLHSNVMFDDLIKQPYTLEKGLQIGIEYELAIWGDEKLTRDQLIEIGKKSIDAGKLMLPEQQAGSLPK